MTAKTTSETASTTASTKGSTAARNFSDIDTGRSFESGKPVTDVEPALLENYRAAGLIGEPEAKSADAA